MLSIGVGTAPTTGATDAIQIYATGATAECYIMDEAGNATLQTPHDKVTGEWIFYSKNVKTGRMVRVDMERMVKAIEKLTGEKFMIDSFEQQGT